MPRPRKPGDDGREVKKRSRNGCWPCKARKVKCGEEKPDCINCQRQSEACDYSIRLNWDGRTKKKEDGKLSSQPSSVDGPPIPSKQLADVPSRDGPGNEPQPIHNSHSLNGLQNDSSDSPLIAIDHVSSLPSLPSFDQPLPPATGLTQHSWQDTMVTGALQGRTVMPQIRQPQPPSSYPSPADSGIGSPSRAINMYTSFGQVMQMPPPLPTSNTLSHPESATSPINSAKRVKLSPRLESLAHNVRMVDRASSYGPVDLDEVQRPPMQPSTPTSQPLLGIPPTPAASSTASDELYTKLVIPRSRPSISQEEDEIRRVSVSSLLSTSTEPDENRPKIQHHQATAAQVANPRAPPTILHQRTKSSSQVETYGLDRGHPDLDLPRNNDTVAITGVSPSEPDDLESWLNDYDIGIPEFGFGLQKRETVFAKGGYYASPVIIKIPKTLEPLPSMLLENPMNLLYFHHFLNHTSRILVPHDCPENPFNSVLPRMAVQNTNLLNLLLAYSASHRARLLSHPEPANRIALWVRNVFPSLRHALDDLSNTKISNSNLATAIMLASLEIISPSTFGVSVPWQNHLNIARNIIKSRGGGPQSISRKDPVAFFLTRWLAYLDVLGSLSGHRNEEPLFGGNYWKSSSVNGTGSPALTREDTEEDDDYTIDCFLGFTTRCVSILAQIATLARQCDWQRISSVTGQADPHWRPSDDVLREANKLRHELENARLSSHKQCPHLGSDYSHSEGAQGVQAELEKGIDRSESLATNSAFHWAGLIHLLRRIHNLPRDDPEVQNAVHKIVDALYEVRPSGSAEACLLFPMFTAGVEAVDQRTRETVLARVRGVEQVGMCQVGRARALMEEVWRTGWEWEALAKGDVFFG